MMSESHILVFTDGASKGNPGPGGWGVIIATPDGHVIELGGGAAMTTNNKMELTGAIAAFSSLEGISGRVSIYTDSTYVIQGIREWMHNWKLCGYPIAVFDLPDDTGVPPRSKGSSRGSAAKGAAYSYLSVVDGRPMRHAT